MSNIDQYESFHYNGETYICKTTLKPTRRDSECGINHPVQYVTQVQRKNKWFFGYQFLFEYNTYDIPEEEHVRLKLACWSVVNDKNKSLEY
jgi:hypothetical protein